MHAPHPKIAMQMQRCSFQNNELFAFHRINHCRQALHWNSYDLLGWLTYPSIACNMPMKGSHAKKCGNIASTASDEIPDSSQALYIQGGFFPYNDVVSPKFTTTSFDLCGMPCLVEGVRRNFLFIQKQCRLQIYGLGIIIQDVPYGFSKGSPLEAPE